MNSIAKLFESLTGNVPFPWQARLLTQLQDGHIPDVCDIPTGLGKTSLIYLWWIALSQQLASGSTRRLPTRLVYIVDRRVVVDQATDEVENLAAYLQSSQPDSSDIPLRISTLRGQRADNQQWLQDPTIPTVIVGTVDMIGSRLLFSPYGRVGKSRRPMHAGLMAQDSWIVVDEAHLCPSFIQTVRSLRDFVRAKPLAPFVLTELSATQLRQEQAVEVFRLDRAQGDFDDARVTQRLEAIKRLKFEPCPEAKSPKALATEMVRHAKRLAGANSSVVLFANTVALVNEIRAQLSAGAEAHTVVLTGEMRGLERDTLKDRLIPFAPKCQRSTQDYPAFLVATSCAEVGINFDADHAVCDLVSLDRMMQRFGRVNRFGNGAAQIVVLNTQRDDTQVSATARVLNTLAQHSDGSLDASPQALQALDRSSGDFIAAWSPAPPTPPLETARLDDWSLTSLDSTLYPRPQASYWLRGLVLDETPTLEFVWRDDLNSAPDSDEAEERVSALPVAQREIASIQLGRAQALLKAIAQRADNADLYLVHQGVDDTFEAHAFSQIARRLAKSGAKLPFENGRVFLPTHVGGLTDGLPDEDATLSVPDAVDDKNWLRLIGTRNGEKCSLRRHDAEPEGAIPFDPEDIFASLADLGENSDHWLLHSEKPIGTDLCPQPGSDESTPPVAGTCWFYLRHRDAPSEGIARSRSSKPITVDEHQADAERFARQLTARLHLPPDIISAIILAAAHHDEGKRRLSWQRSIGNYDTSISLAKSTTPRMDRSQTEGYRHEFGSLIDLTKPGPLADRIANHPEGDLILHLVASHHAWARPHFPPAAFDPQHPQLSTRIAAESALRFERLQRRFGWWQLAYLESLVRSADALASQHAANL